MLSPHLELVDLDAAHWHNWWELLWPPGLDADHGWAIAYLEGELCTRVIVRGRGEVSAAAWTGAGARELAAFRRALDVGVVVAVQVDALGELFADAETKLSLDDDYVAQWLTILGAVKRARGRGALAMDPPLLDAVPAIQPGPLQKTFDLLVPDNASLIAYVFDGPALYTSIIASKERGDIAFATTHAGIADAVHAARLVRSWRKGYRKVVEVVGERYDPPAIGLFAERAAIQRVLTGPPDQLARELANKDILVDPCPAWLRALLGGAAVAGAATRSAQAISRLLPAAARRAARDVARTAQSALEDSRYSPWALLGFDPISLWLEARRLLFPNPRS